MNIGLCYKKTLFRIINLKDGSVYFRILGFFAKKI
eukprot:UN28129